MWGRPALLLAEFSHVEGPKALYITELFGGALGSGLAVSSVAVPLFHSLINMTACTAPGRRVYIGRTAVSGESLSPEAYQAVCALIGRVISCETPHRGSMHGGEAIFTQEEIGCVASHIFFVKDLQARGERRTFALIAVHPSIDELMCRWPLLCAALRNISVMISRLSHLVFMKEYQSTGHNTAAEFRQQKDREELRPLSRLVGKCFILCAAMCTTSEPAPTMDSEGDQQRFMEHNDERGDSEEEKVKTDVEFRRALHTMFEVILTMCFLPTADKLIYGTPQGQWFAQNIEEALRAGNTSQLSVLLEMAEEYNTDCTFLRQSEPSSAIHSPTSEAPQIATSTVSSSPQKNTKSAAIIERKPYMHVVRVEMAKRIDVYKALLTTSVRDLMIIAQNSKLSSRELGRALELFISAARPEKVLPIDYYLLLTIASNYDIQKIQPPKTADSLLKEKKKSFAHARHDPIASLLQKSGVVSPVALWLRRTWEHVLHSRTDDFSRIMSCIFTALFKGNQIIVTPNTVSRTSDSVSRNSQISSQDVQACRAFALSLAELLPAHLRKVNVDSDEYELPCRYNILAFSEAFYLKNVVYDFTSMLTEENEDKTQLVLSEMDSIGTVCVCLSHSVDESRVGLWGGANEDWKPPPRRDISMLQIPHLGSLTEEVAQSKLSQGADAAANQASPSRRRPLAMRDILQYYIAKVLEVDALVDELKAVENSSRSSVESDGELPSSTALSGSTPASATGHAVSRFANFEAGRQPTITSCIVKELCRTDFGSCSTAIAAAKAQRKATSSLSSSSQTATPAKNQLSEHKQIIVISAMLKLIVQQTVCAARIYVAAYRPRLLRRTVESERKSERKSTTSPIPQLASVSVAPPPSRPGFFKRLFSSKKQEEPSTGVPASAVRDLSFPHMSFDGTTTPSNLGSNPARALAVSPPVAFASPTPSKTSSLLNPKPGGKTSIRSTDSADSGMKTDVDLVNVIQGATGVHDHDVLMFLGSVPSVFGR